MTISRTLGILFFCFISLMPAIGLLYNTCRSFIRSGEWIMLLAITGLVLNYYFCMLFYAYGLMPYMILNLITTVGYILFAFVITEKGHRRLLFVLGIVLNFNSVCSSTAIGLYYRIGMKDDLFGWKQSLVLLFITCLFFPAYYWLLIRKIRPLLEKNANDLSWKILWMVPVLFCVLHYYSIWSSNGDFSAQWTNVLFLCIVNFCSAVISYLIADMADERARRISLEIEKAELIMQTNQYNRLQERMEETRRARHDLRQHLRLIQYYLETKDDKALQEYIKTYGQSLPQSTRIHYCKNDVVDTVVRFYAEQAETNNIQYETSLFLPENLRIDKPDLCVLFGNLLENAMESCMKHLDQHPSIRVCAKLLGEGTLSITVDNSPADPPKKKNKHILSTKEGGTAFGTYSVEQIARRYDGEARFEWQDGTFYTSVVLMLPPAKQTGDKDAVQQNT